MINRFKTMRLVIGAMLVGFFLASPVHAADVKNGRAMVTPAKDDRYTIDGFTFGKAELFGYISDLKDTKKITGIVLKNGKKASDEQKRVIGSVGKGLQIEAFVLDGKELVPIAAQ